MLGATALVGVPWLIGTNAVLEASHKNCDERLPPPLSDCWAFYSGFLWLMLAVIVGSLLIGSGVPLPRRQAAALDIASRSPGPNQP